MNNHSSPEDSPEVGNLRPQESVMEEWAAAKGLLISAGDDDSGKLALDNLVQTEPIYILGAVADPAQGDIDHLCKVWAEVGRAILARRQVSHEAKKLE